LIAGVILSVLAGFCSSFAFVRSPTGVHKAQFEASRDGEVFLYVNDAALTLP